MKMNLISGKIETQDNKFGIENLKKIIVACEHIKSLFQKLQAEKAEQKGFWKRIGAFFKRLFGTYSDIETVVSDIVQIVQNKAQISQEINDLKGSELYELAEYLSKTFGYEFNESKDKIMKALPQWLQGWASFLNM